MKLSTKELSDEIDKRGSMTPLFVSSETENLLDSDLNIGIIFEYFLGLHWPTKDRRFEDFLLNPFVSTMDLRRAGDSQIFY